MHATADGAAYDATDLRTLQDWIIRPQLRQVPGVTEINTIGGYERQFHVTPDPARCWRMASLCDDVVAALRRTTPTSARATSRRNGEQYLIRSPGQVGDIEDIERHHRRAPQRRADHRQ